MRLDEAMLRAQRLVKVTAANLERTKKLVKELRRGYGPQSSEQGKKRMVYIVDIDGTLADLSHRAHFIEQNPPDWDGFYAACGNDTPIDKVIDTVRALQRAGAEIFLLTGRSDVCRLQTIKWVNKHVNITYSLLLMRKEGDHREDTIVKSEMLDVILGIRQLKDIYGAFEDRKQVVDMYRKRGLKVFQVADGDF